MISEKKREQLSLRMAKVGIFEKDLVEHFIRSGGHGGQNVNKVNTCVYIKHLPSEIEVKCQKTRHQADNRYFAREILCEKIETQILGKKSAAEKERYKIKKQKQKRSKRAKEKILQQKKHQSEKKSFRSKPEF
ncbi:MAG: peptide chain release factor-like protein [Deltaproteobacteria bacterium]|nr:peptide chain release factor-like protein [Deltaproteobacteria bacterium]